MAPPANPYQKKSKRKPKTSKRLPQVRHGAAQAEFVAATRKAIDLKVNFFDENDWRSISMSHKRGTSLAGKKRIRADDFYVKNVAAWVPHLMLAGHVPPCARCLAKDHVDVNNTKWVENPKLLHGTVTHRHLGVICASVSKNTVFPQPDGPTIARSSPARSTRACPARR